MSDNIQDKETLKQYCLEKYEELKDNMYIFIIQGRDVGKKKFEEELKRLIEEELNGKR